MGAQTAGVLTRGDMQRFIKRLPLKYRLLARVLLCCAGRISEGLSVRRCDVQSGKLRVQTNKRIVLARTSENCTPPVARPH